MQVHTEVLYQLVFHSKNRGQSLINNMIVSHWEIKLYLLSLPAINNNSCLLLHVVIIVIINIAM